MLMLGRNTQTKPTQNLVLINLKHNCWIKVLVDPKHLAGNRPFFFLLQSLCSSVEIVFASTNWFSSQWEFNSDLEIQLTCAARLFSVYFLNLVKWLKALFRLPDLDYLCFCVWGWVYRSIKKRWLDYTHLLS